MVQLTVFLIRNGESQEDVEEKLGLSQRVDPPLTELGFEEAQLSMRSLIDALVKAGDERKMALFSAPMKHCTGSALMISCAGLNRQECLQWRMTTVDAAKAPAAVPVIVVNGLANSAPEIQKLGGDDAVVGAGLLHCAADPFNDARNKCPFMNVIKAMKSDTQVRVKKWKAADSTRFVTEVQYLRIEDEADPWSLQPLTPKVNIVVDYVEPKKYMTPPRRGNFNANDKKSKVGSEISIQRAVWWARQVGCDTVFMTVPEAAIKAMMEPMVEGGEIPTAPGCVASFVADVGESEEDIAWELHSMYQLPDLQYDGAGIIPEFGGPVDTLVEPPHDKDPSTVPPNQWSRFPPPPPENIPEDYPDLPPFSQALISAVPDVKWEPNTGRQSSKGSRDEDSSPISNDFQQSDEPFMVEAASE